MIVKCYRNFKQNLPINHKVLHIKDYRVYLPTILHTIHDANTKHKSKHNCETLLKRLLPGMLKYIY